MASDSPDSMKVPDPAEENAAQTPGPVTMKTEERESLDWDFLLDFRQMVRELERDDDICHVEWATYDPVPDFTLETLEHGLGITVPEFITEFYRLSDGLYLSWDRRTDDGVIPGGGFEVFDFATVFDSWLETLWPTDPADPPDSCDADFLWSLRGVATPPHASTADDAPTKLEHMIVMCVEEEYPTYDLFVHHPDDFESHLLKLDFHGFLDALMETRGLYGWPYLVVETDLAEESKLTTIQQRTRRRLDQWFPEAEWP